MKKRITKITTAILLVTLTLFIASRFVSAPMEGYWHTELTDCLCDSKNLLSFKDGNVIRYSTGHGEPPVTIGTYWFNEEENSYEFGGDGFRFKPGWFKLQINQDGDDMIYRGYRELRWTYINEVLNHFKNQPADQGGVINSESLRSST